MFTLIIGAELANVKFCAESIPPYGKFSPPAPLEWNGERVLRTAHLIEYYDCEEHQIFDNFRRKNAGFIESVHYVVVAGKNLSNLRMNNPQMQISSKARRVFFWTADGAELQAKMLNTDKAWKAFKLLAETYFLVKVEVPDEAAIDFCTEMSPVVEGQLRFFEHEQFGKVRVIMIDGKMWFVGSDVAAALKYSNPQKALRDHIPDKFKRVEQFVISGQKRKLILIDEAGLYKLILRSKMPAAEEFSDWICSEVIPSIYKTGTYSIVTPDNPAPVAPAASAVDLAAIQAQIDELKTSFETLTYAFEEWLEHMTSRRLTNSERGEKLLQIADKLIDLSESQPIEREFLIKAGFFFVGKKFV